MNTKLTGIGSRLIRRLLFLVWVALFIGATGAKAEPVKTLVQDTLYRADGSVAQGTIAIRWNGFSTSAGEAVMAGELTIATDVNGGIAIPLIPNAGSSPAGSYYKVVVKLDDGTTSEEVWVVPAATTTTVAAIRAKVVPQAVAAQFASIAYVNSLLNNLAANPPVHLSGAESISGTKTFLASPEVPVPSDVGGAANKGYVDQKVSAQPSVNLTSPGPIGSVTPGTVNATSITASGNVGASATVTGGSPASDIRAFGAVIDGATDIGSALVAATAQACTGSGVVFLPCAGTSGCYLANGTALAQLANSAACGSTAQSVQFKLQGTLKLGSTFVVPDRSDLIGDGGGISSQFQGSHPVATVVAPAVHGTMGTAIGAAGSATFTPTFAGGSIANVQVGTAITIAGTTSCSISAISRAANMVTATTSGYCRIPAGTVVTVAGVTDASYNATPLIVTADYPAQAFTWQETGANSASSGGTITGFNEDSMETVGITAVAGSTATATFLHPHGSADTFGMVALAMPPSTYNHHGFDGIAVWSNYGAAIWGQSDAYIDLSHMALGTIQSGFMTSMAADLDGCWAYTIRDSAFTGNTLQGRNCVSGACSYPSAYPYGLRLSAFNASEGGTDAYGEITGNSTVTGGIKEDSNGLSGVRLGDLRLDDLIVEQAIQAAVTIDNRYVPSILPVIIHHVTLQDNFSLYAPVYVSFTDSNPAKPGNVQINNMSTVITTQAVNKYFTGYLKINGIDHFQGELTLPIRNTGPMGTIDDGLSLEAELRGEAAGLGPALIPYATQNVTTSPASWTCSGTGCSVNTGILAPDGTATAGEIVSGSASASVTVETISTSTAVGDCFLFGSWAMAGVNSTTYASSQAGPFALYTFGTDSFDQGSTAYATGFQSQYNGDWWHPVVASTCITTGEATAHTIRFNLYAPNASGWGNRFWMPFLIKVPASAGVPFAEIQRWRQQLLHGVVPPNMPGSVLGINPAMKLYWGSDTNLYRGSANVLQTDGSFNLNGSGTYQIGGTPIKSTNLGDFSSTAATTTGQVPVWNNSTGKYVPGTVGGGSLILDFTTTTAPSGATGSAPTWTYTLPATCNVVTAYLISGGAPGASGATCASTSATCYGGGGGIGATYQIATVPCSFFGGPGASITVGVGVGATGGPAQSTASSNGNFGTVGAASYVKGPNGYGELASLASNSGGSGGTTTTGTGGTQASSYSIYLNCPGANGSSGIGGAAVCANGGATGGSGGGGLINGTPAAGGAQPSISAAIYRGPVYTTASLTGGTTSTPNGQTPTYASSPLTTTLLSAAGGTGGASQCTANGGAGGAGMTPGGGGAGGGAACNGFSSGAGGPGGPGWVELVIQ